MLSYFVEGNNIFCFNVASPTAFKIAVYGFYNLAVNYNIEFTACCYKLAVEYTDILCFNFELKGIYTFKCTILGTNFQ